MLQSLHVKNLALVQDIAIELQSGLNVMTGETGAGKSILIGALKLLLGERADKGMIRAGETTCSVQAVFDLADPDAVNEVLDSFGLDPCESGQLILRRTLKESGSGQNLVNDNPVTLQVFKNLGDHLVDMHGPHDHQSLLHLDTQLRILDAFGKVEKEFTAYRKAYESLQALERRKAELMRNDQDVDALLDVLSFRVKELEEADLKMEEEEEIRQEHQVVGNAQRILELANQVVMALTESDEAAFDRIAGAHQAMDELARLLPEAEAWQNELEEASARVRDLSASVRETADGIEADQARLDFLDRRLSVYSQMKRKYGGSVESALQTLEESRTRLADLQNRDEQLQELEHQIASERTVLEAVGGALRKKRTAAAGKLAKAITEELRLLGFPHGAFDVGMEPDAPGPNGLDRIEFGFAPNAGEPARPLRMIASSGEISRVMLAGKAVLARHDRIPLLVFDEIDANVGGEMGQAIGRKMAEVAKTHQIICITHLPQVAIFGATHFAVRKEVVDQRTFTRVDRLNDASRVEEVARMLGGRDLTSVTLDHAREMLEQV